MRWASFFAAIVLLGGCVQAQDCDIWDCIQAIPVFYDCRDGADTQVILTCHSESPVRYGWTMYNAYGEFMQSWDGPIQPGALKPWQPRWLLEEAPTGFDEWDTAWGLFMIYVLDDPSQQGSLSVTVARYDSTGRGLGREHVSQLPLAYEEEGRAYLGAFYRATQTTHDILTVANASSDDVEFAVRAFDLSGNLVIEEFGYLLPYECDYYELQDLVPQPPSEYYQGVLKVVADLEDKDTLLLVLTHWQDANWYNLFRHEQLP